ncbi:hypothetical protein IAI10_13905 [Clostridium sp. 19966]|uniref:hypothetical protein n=1 Tax=Clostridium sp. 19966 TaxID=2768166 RepID=UPI0028E062D0|nr:hypothetical protein [Clostridium sp. 19966]MDT8717759.1 hypothetical protein [Clostridium sp. 19966]
MPKSIKICILSLIIILISALSVIFFTENAKSNQVGLDKIPSSNEIKKLVISQFGKKITISKSSDIEKIIKLIDSNSSKKAIDSRDGIIGAVYVVEIIPMAPTNNSILVIPYGNTFNYLVERDHKVITDKWYKIANSLSDVVAALYYDK